MDGDGSICVETRTQFAKHTLRIRRIWTITTVRVFFYDFQRHSRRTRSIQVVFYFFLLLKSFSILLFLFFSSFLWTANIRVLHSLYWNKHSLDGHIYLYIRMYIIYLMFVFLVFISLYLLKCFTTRISEFIFYFSLTFWHNFIFQAFSNAVWIICRVIFLFLFSNIKVASKMHV